MNADLQDEHPTCLLNLKWPHWLKNSAIHYLCVWMELEFEITFGHHQMKQGNKLFIMGNAHFSLIMEYRCFQRPFFYKIMIRSHFNLYS